MRGSSNCELRRAGAALVRGQRPRSAVAAARRLGVVGAGERDHAAADPGGTGAARARGVAGTVANPAVAGGRRAGRRGQAVGAAGLPAPRGAAARHREGPDRRPRRAGAGLGRRRCGNCRESAPTPRPPWPASRSGSATRCWTPMCGGCWPGCWAGEDLPPRRRPSRRYGWPSRCCRPTRRAGGPLVGRGHGTGCAGLHRGAAALSAVPGGRAVRVARGGPPGRPGTPNAARATRAPTGSAAAGCSRCCGGRRPGAGQHAGRGLAGHRAACARARRPDRRRTRDSRRGRLVRPAGR